MSESFKKNFLLGF